MFDVLARRVPLPPARSTPNPGASRGVIAGTCCLSCLPPIGTFERPHAHAATGYWDSRGYTPELPDRQAALTAGGHLRSRGAGMRQVGPVVEALQVLGRFSVVVELEQVSDPSCEDVAHFGRGGEKELLAIVGNVHAPVGEVLMQLGFEGDGVLGEELARSDIRSTIVVLGDGVVDLSKLGFQVRVAITCLFKRGEGVDEMSSLLV